MSMIGAGRVWWRGGRRLTAGSVVLLAVCAVLGLFPSVVQASSSSAPTWARQAPAAHPSARAYAAMAYDAATGTIVLFGGQGCCGVLGDTWTWNGTTLTKRHPASHPSARSAAAMAYDAATGTIVLFGGANNQRDGYLGDTWTWNGITWTKQAPAVHPLARTNEAMAYDAATRTIVLFGGYHNVPWGDTYTWNGTTWTLQAPASSPPAQYLAAMAYDAATRTAVLSSGFDASPPDTWTWNGTTWTQQRSYLPPRSAAAMAYDAATRTIVLFGGLGTHHDRADTWTWDGTAWTQQAPAAHPSARESAAMAYDAATRTIVLFGGTLSRGGLDADTWTWG